MNAQKTRAEKTVLQAALDAVGREAEIAEAPEATQTATPKNSTSPFGMYGLFELLPNAATQPLRLAPR